MCIMKLLPNDTWDYLLMWAGQKNGAFKYLKNQVWNKVQGWMKQCLSAGGKEVLIKAVAQAIPTYSMGCFRLPRGLVKQSMQ